MVYISISHPYPRIHWILSRAEMAELDNICLGLGLWGHEGSLRLRLLNIEMASSELNWTPSHMRPYLHNEIWISYGLLNSDEISSTSVLFLIKYLEKENTYFLLDEIYLREVILLKIVWIRRMSSIFPSTHHLLLRLCDGNGSAWF